jgi:hypothetical protein
LARWRRPAGPRAFRSAYRVFNFLLAATPALIAHHQLQSIITDRDALREASEPSGPGP